MGPLGWQETVAIFILALIIFGPKKLPELGRTVAKAIAEFRRASNELKSTWDREMSTLERENESLREATRDFKNQIYSPDDSSYYDSGYDSGAYGSDSYSYDSTASDTSTVSASATQGAESTTAKIEENGGETAVETAALPEPASTETNGTAHPSPKGSDPHAVTT